MKTKTINRIWRQNCIRRVARILEERPQYGLCDAVREVQRYYPDTTHGAWLTDLCQQQLKECWVWPNMSRKLGSIGYFQDVNRSSNYGRCDWIHRPLGTLQRLMLLAYLEEEIRHGRL